MKIFTDASRLDNGDIGIGILFINDSDKIVGEYSYKVPIKGESIFGELCAILYALSMINFKVDKIELFTDSLNVINYTNGVYKNEKSIYSDFIELLEREIDRVNSLTKYGLRIKKVKAHSGNVFNNRVDKLASKALK